MPTNIPINDIKITAVDNKITASLNGCTTGSRLTTNTNLEWSPAKLEVKFSQEQIDWLKQRLLEDLVTLDLPSSIIPTRVTEPVMDRLDKWFNEDALSLLKMKDKVAELEGDLAVSRSIAEALRSQRMDEQAKRIVAEQKLQAALDLLAEVSRASVEETSEAVDGLQAARIEAEKKLAEQKSIYDQMSSAGIYQKAQVADPWTIINDTTVKYDSTSLRQISQTISNATVY